MNQIQNAGSFTAFLGDYERVGGCFPCVSAEQTKGAGRAISECPLFMGEALLDSCGPMMARTYMPLALAGAHKARAI